MEFRELARGLQFPEGPIAMPDGSVILVEIRRGTLSRVTRDGSVEVIAELGGGPNGAAMGPDGRCYVCNNGGFEWLQTPEGQYYPGDEPADYEGGRIEAVDIATGAVEVLYTECEGRPLKGPNDIVFDRHGGFYFSDLGKFREHDIDRGVVYYAHCDGSMIRPVRTPMVTPNGVGLSPGEGRLYVAESLTTRLYGFPITAPGQLASVTDAEALVTGSPHYEFYDSLAVDSVGNICIGTLVNGGVSIIAADGSSVRHVPVDDPMVTNICFGGPGLRTAYLTCSLSGRLLTCEWEVPGLPLNFLDPAG